MQDKAFMLAPLLFPWPRSGHPHFFILSSPLSIFPLFSLLVGYKTWIYEDCGSLAR